MLSLLLVDESHTTQTEFRVMFFVSAVFQGLLCAYYFAHEELDPTKHVMLNSAAEGVLYTLTRSYVSVALVSFGVCLKIFLKYADEDPVEAKYVQAASYSMVAVQVISEATRLTHNNGHSVMSYFAKIFGNACSDTYAMRLSVLWTFKFVVIVLTACYAHFGDMSALNCAYGAIVLILILWASAWLQNLDNFNVNKIDA